MPGHEIGVLEALGLNHRDLQSAVEHVDVDVGLSDLDYDDNPCIVLVNNINNMTDLFVVIFLQIFHCNLENICKIVHFALCEVQHNA